MLRRNYVELSCRLSRLPACTSRAQTIVRLFICSLWLGGIALTGSAQSYTFSVLAGQPGMSGSMDGPATQALFNNPTGIALDKLGNVYVCDRGNFIIRQISTNGSVSTFAGSSGIAGAADGVGVNAQFRDPSGIAIDSAGNIYIADTGNATIRKITPDGQVSTYAGMAGTLGSVDGPRASARFTRPETLAIDRADTLYVSDDLRIRKILANGTVSTPVTAAERVNALAVNRVDSLYGAGANHLFVPSGSNTSVIAGANGPGGSGSVDGLGVIARFNGIHGLGVDDGGNLYAADSGNSAVRRLSLEGTVTTIANGDPSVVIGSPFGIALDGTGSLYVTDVANHCVYLGAVTDQGRLVNLSARAFVGTDADLLIAGFFATGSNAKQMLMRGIGPTLSQFGVSGVLAQPEITLFDSLRNVEATNQGWGGDAALSDAFAQTGAFPLSVKSIDAALISAVSPGAHTINIVGLNNTTGVALAEIYDADPENPAARLTNLSARGHVGTGDNVLIAGFIVDASNEHILIRGIGPALTPFGVPGVLANPKLQLYRHGTLVAENDDWGGTPELAAVFAQTGAFVIDAASKDAALVVTLTPGAYTAILSGSNSGTGVGLLEIYEIP